MSVLSIDFETRSTVDLRKTGVYPYAAHPDTGIWCMAWAFDDDDPEIWFPREHEASPVVYCVPDAVQEHVLSGGEIRAWNAAFERAIWREILAGRYGAVPAMDNQFVCSMAESAAMALPLSLDQTAAILGVTQQKDKSGYELMLRMTRPRKVLPDGTIIWWDVPERKARLYEYCKQDVRTERAVVQALRRLSDKERQVYLLDQRMNDRGVRIDRPLIVAAMELAKESTERAELALAEITGGAVQEVTDVVGLKQFLAAEGVETTSVSKATVAELLSSDLSPNARAALDIRVDAGRSSVAKLDRMLACASEPGDRIRGLFQYHGATTGRWSGRLVQPQNFPRGDVEDAESFIPTILAGDYDSIDIMAPPLAVVSSLLRGMIVPAEGYDFIAGDYSAIEARVLNWLAGQDDVLANFAAMDAGDKTKHPYKMMAVAMGRGASAADIKKPSEDYQAGKAAELGCGYQMGARKFVEAAWKVYQVRVTTEQSETAVKAYRATHPLVQQLWWDTEKACVNAVRRPGVKQVFGGRKNLIAIVKGAYLYLRLPSGRFLCYAVPSVAELPVPWDANQTKPTLEYWGIDSYSRKWGKLRAYGGLLVENIVQAVSRDILVEGMLRTEAAGYGTPVLSVHDESVSEVPQDFGSVDEYTSLLATNPAWAAGLPLAVEAWRGQRYRK